MSIDVGDAVANAILDAVETTWGSSPKLVILTGSKPANCAAAETGTRLAVATLPADPMNAAASRSKTKTGTWQDASADAAGTAGYYRLYNNGETVCHEQGTVTVTAGGGDLTLDDVSIEAGQQVTINTWTRNY